MDEDGFWGDESSAMDQPGFSMRTYAFVLHGGRMTDDVSWQQALEIGEALRAVGLQAVPGGDLSPETGAPNGSDPDEKIGIGLGIGAAIASAEANADEQGSPGAPLSFDAGDVERAHGSWTARREDALRIVREVAPHASIEEGVVLVPAGPLAAAWLIGGEEATIIEDGETHARFQTSTEGAGIVCVELRGRTFAIAAQYD